MSQIIYKNMIDEMMGKKEKTKKNHKKYYKAFDDIK